MPDITPPSPASFTRGLFSSKSGLGDSVVVAGLVFAAAACLFEGWNVIIERRPFDMMAFGAMAIQIMGGIGGGVGAREFLSNRNGPQPPG